MPFTFERVKRSLLEEQTKLRDQLEHFEVTDFEDIGGSNHMADDATEAFDQTVDVAVKRAVETALEKVEYALAKLEDGTYGICESCGGRIDRARLEILPDAVYCMECQTRREQGQSR